LFSDDETMMTLVARGKSDRAIPAMPPHTTLVALAPTVATRYARRAITCGKNVVFIGSHVQEQISERAELALKRAAARHGSWVLTPHGYAHAFRRGPVGIVGTAGTGIQQLGCLLHQCGIGVSNIFSVGSRDFSKRIRGLETLRALRVLNFDPRTKIIALILKPLHPRQERQLTLELSALRKPVVGIVLGDADAPRARLGTNVLWSATVDAMVDVIAEWIGGHVKRRQDRVESRAIDGHRQTVSGYIRGFFSGGSCCAEVAAVLMRVGLPVHSNCAVRTRGLRDINRWPGHICIDLGAGVKVHGKIHYPMADLTLRSSMILRAARHSKTGVIIFDVFLGHGSHPQPAEKLAVAVRQGRAIAAAQNRRLLFVAAVIGIDSDPQGLDKQTHVLKQAGVIVARTVGEAAHIAATAVKKHED
jgi:FdrA protein